ncbi:hypothetical protein [Candidatus Nitronereus thalassa]|uniref:Uncharacterized protein n=1 Tax=Candidatus Nitronereus thalassa TaxID=3020898 RepID=A0ABU3K7Q9_9BACT|nr:hypothetical protein [Candidatus Nitronereus thalassa]MDT7042399.1 hypothetical protein [Candidatus Nitronereus thalassa]
MKYTVENFRYQSRAVPYKTSPLWWWVVGVGIGLFLTAFMILNLRGEALADPGVPGEVTQAASQVVQRYSQAVAASDPIAVAQNDFVCLLKMMEAGSLAEDKFPADSDQIYSWCWDRLVQAHEEVIEQRDRALDELWPGVGKLVNFSDFKRFLIAETNTDQRAPSFFVIPQIGAIAGSPGFSMEILGAGPLPHASFQIKNGDHAVAVPTVFVRTRIAYPNPMTSPVANGPGEMDWNVPYKKPLHPIKAVTVKWVVLTGLKQHGFPTDAAVLNMPLVSPMGTPIPFVVESGGFVQNTTEYWKAQEAGALLSEGVEQAKALPTSRERIAMLNRVLAVDPHHVAGLEAITHELYEGLLAFAARTHGVEVSGESLYEEFNELYWTVQSGTDRFDLSTHMEMGGKSEPTPADYLYRMIPAMETLVDLRPGDFETRLRLISAYRWTNDQVTSIMAPQQLLSEVPQDYKQLRAKTLLAIAWSRISKVAWNRHFDDPDIIRGYEEADEAFHTTNEPLVKFSASYAKAYSLAFRPERDNAAMLELLTEAKQWYEKIPGSSNQSWAYMLQNDTLKGLVETDPAFRSLLTSNS